MRDSLIKLMPWMGGKGQLMAASKNMIALEINGLHVHLTFTPFPADDTVAAVRAILKNSYVRTLQT